MQASEPDATVVNSLLRSSSSYLQKLTLEDLKEDFPSPNPQDDSTFTSPSPDGASSPAATQFLPTLVFSSHDDREVSDGVSHLGDDGGVTRVAAPVQVAKHVGEQAQAQEAPSSSPQKTETAPTPAPAPAAVVDAPAEKQPKKKKAAVPALLPTTSILMEKRVVPGAAPKDVAPLAPAPAPAPTPTSAPVDRWWEKGANAVRKEDPPAEWATVAGKPKRGAKTAW